MAYKYSFGSEKILTKKDGKMKDTLEIRWHGRGGQGAKTAALLLGPERMGAPITAYDRISDQPIRVHSNIYDPQYVVVVDETLIEIVDVTKGLREDGAILINTARPKEEIIPHLKGYKGKVYTVDARKIAMETLGKNFPNTPMLAAIVKVTGVIDDETFLNEMEGSFKHKFAKKPEVIKGNMDALRIALREVK